MAIADGKFWTFRDEEPMVGAMEEHCVAEARERLAELVERALDGEEVLITQDGQPVIELRPIPVSRPAKPVSKAGLEWLDAHRITPLKIGDSGKLVREMRDEGDC